MKKTIAAIITIVFIATSITPAYALRPIAAGNHNEPLALSQRLSDDEICRSCRSDNKADKRFIEAQKCIQKGDFEEAKICVKEAITLLQQTGFGKLDRSGFLIADTVERPEVAIRVIDRLEKAGLIDEEMKRLSELLKAGKNGLELKQGLGYVHTGTVKISQYMLKDFAYLDRLVAKVKEGIENQSPVLPIDSFIYHIEEIIKSRAGLQEIAADTALVRVFRKLYDLFIPAGYLLELVNINLERSLILYQIEEKEIRSTLQGPVEIFYVRRVTEVFDDRELDEGLGWSPIDTDHVVINRGLIEAIDAWEIKNILTDPDFMPFMPEEEESSEGKLAIRMLKIYKNLVKKAFAELEERVGIIEESSCLHEIEHEVCRRILKAALRKGITNPALAINLVIEQQLAISYSLKAMNKPWYELGHIVSLAARGDIDAWAVLKAMSDCSDKNAAVDWLEDIVREEDDRLLRMAAEKAYQVAEKQWLAYYNLPVKPGTALPIIHEVSPRQMQAIDESA